jgi:hypothetical protein
MQMEYIILANYSTFCTTEKRIINKYCHRNTQAPNGYGEQIFMNRGTRRCRRGGGGGGVYVRPSTGRIAHWLVCASTLHLSASLLWVWEMTAVYLQLSWQKTDEVNCSSEDAQTVSLLQGWWQGGLSLTEEALISDTHANNSCLQKFVWTKEMSIGDDLINTYICRLLCVEWVVEWLEKWKAKQIRHSDFGRIYQLLIEFPTAEYSKEQVLNVVATDMLQFRIVKDQSSYV